MKKIILALFTILLCFSFVACGENEKEALTSEQIVQKFKDDYSLPVVQELTYTEETDVNGLLGRPGKYVSKTNWNDERDTDSVNYQNDESMTAYGDYRECTIEVFENESDAKDRKEYIESTWDVGGILSQDQYIYLNSTALLRIPYALTPEQAKEYENAFNEIMEK